jgi:hypothetical protein
MLKEALMKRLRWQHWVLIMALASIAYVFVISIVFAMRGD